MRRLATIPGNVPNPADAPSGCRFHPRCPLTRELADGADETDVERVVTTDETFQVLKSCQTHEPALREVVPNQFAACDRVEGYSDASEGVPVLDQIRDTHHSQELGE